MALTLLAANNAQSVLAAGISASATSLTLNTGTGALFPSPVSGTSFFKLTLIDAATGSLTEIVHVTARAGDVFTIQRGQEGTVPRAWSANDIAANMMTAGTLSYILGSFQPLDATLTALATLTGAADKLPYFNGDDTAALTVLTAFAREILAQTDAAGVLSKLGLGKLSIAGVSGGSLATSGYITIPMIISGERRVLYIQWGGFSGTTSSSDSNGVYENSNITVTWPVAFPNAVFQVITGGSSDVSGAGQQEMAWGLDKTKTNGTFGFQCRTPNALMTGSYLAIGY